VDWSYIAGYFDADGCLASITKNRKRKRNYKSWIASIGSVDKEPLEKIQAFLLSRNVISRIYPTRTPRKNTYYMLEVFRKNSVRRFLYLIKPHLINKKEKVDAYFGKHVETHLCETKE